MAKQRILVLADDRRGHTGNLLEHIAAFGRYSRHAVSLFNPRDVSRSRFLRVDDFDVVVIHYSIVPTVESYLPRFLVEQIVDFSGLKIQFLQDEYRWVDDMTAQLRNLGIDVLFTITPERELERLYGGRLPGVKIIPTLAGFVPEKLVGLRTPPTSARPIDVGYRGRVLPFWNGALSQEKYLIGRGFLKHARMYGLNCDIAWGEHDRIYGDRWVRFLMSCKATLGAESGTSITDFDGSVERETIAYLAEHPGATFEETQDAVLRRYEGNVMMNVPSPRLFEAAALRTTMVLFPGEYGGVVRPNEHYISLEKDFSNIADVVDSLRDEGLTRRLQETAYADIVESGTYSMHREIEHFDAVVDELSEPANLRSHRRRFLLARLERPLTTGVVARVDLGHSARTLAWLTTTSRLVVTDPPLARLVRRYVTSPTLWRRTTPRRLHHDLMRLSLLRRAQRGRPVTTERFTVKAVFNERAERLTFKSELQPSVEHVIEVTRLPETVLWDHSSVGYGVHISRVGRWIGIPVGYYGTVGVHHFGALERIGEVFPQLVHDALTPLLAPPVARRRGVVARQLIRVLPGRLGRRIAALTVRDPANRPPLAWAVLRSPRNYVVKAILVGWIALTRPGLRRLLRRALDDPGLMAAFGRVLLFEDIVKLYAVQEANLGRVPGVTRVDLAVEDGKIVFQTRRDEPHRYLTAWPAHAHITSLEWDNRDIGRTLTLPTRLSRRLQLSLEPDGRHEFQAVSTLAARDASVWDLVRRDANRRRRLSQAIGRAPLRSAIKTLVVANLALKHPSVRRVFRTWALSRSLREEVTLAALAADLVKLHALELTARGNSRDVRGVERMLQGDVVTYASTPVPTDFEPACILRDAMRPGTTLIWDNSAANVTRIRVAEAVGPLPVSIRFDGSLRHRFDALTVAVSHDGSSALLV